MRNPTLYQQYILMNYLYNAGYTKTTLSCALVSDYWLAYKKKGHVCCWLTAILVAGFDLGIHSSNL